MFHSLIILLLIFVLIITYLSYRLGKNQATKKVRNGKYKINDMKKVKNALKGGEFILLFFLLTSCKNYIVCPEIPVVDLETQQYLLHLTEQNNKLDRFLLDYYNLRLELKKCQ